MLTPVIPHYVEDELGLGKVAVGVAVGAFAFGAIALRPFAGRIGDRMGRRVLIVGGALVVAVSTAMYGLVQALWWLTRDPGRDRHRRGRVLRRCGDDDHRPLAGGSAGRGGELLVGCGVRRPRVRPRARRSSCAATIATRSRGSCRRGSRWSPPCSGSRRARSRVRSRTDPSQLINRGRGPPGLRAVPRADPARRVQRVHAAVRRRAARHRRRARSSCSTAC